MNEVYILGGERTDFKRNLKKEGKTIRHLITEAGKKAIDDAKVDPGDINAGMVGNFNAGQFTKQLHLGAFLPERARGWIARGVSRAARPRGILNPLATRMALP